MHLLVVAGMLGVGKTSLILRMLDPMIEKKLKVVVIENEIGEMGVDSEVLERSGMKVRDLKGGCVCCTMQGSLVDNLRAVEMEYSPDVVIVEPTGIADPGMVIKSVTDVEGINIDRRDVVVLIDCERFLKIRKMFERPLKNQMKCADIVLLNKIDTVSENDLKEIEDGVKSFDFNGKILRVRGDIGEGVSDMMEVVGL